ncbi:unnamed protein product [Absidia cylindrospora]
MPTVTKKSISLFFISIITFTQYTLNIYNGSHLSSTVEKCYRNAQFYEHSRACHQNITRTNCRTMVTNDEMYRNAGAVQRQGKDGKVMYQVALGQQPGQLYCMVDGGVVIEAEKEMESILSRLKNIWQLRQSITVEGTSFDIDDFTLRVANILVGSTYKGLLLEVRQRQ